MCYVDWRLLRWEIECGEELLSGYLVVVVVVVLGSLLFVRREDEGDL